MVRFYYIIQCSSTSSVTDTKIANTLYIKEIVLAYYLIDGGTLCYVYLGHSFSCSFYDCEVVIDII